jgi:hypothetical protein
MFIENPPRQSPDLVWKKPIEQVSHRSPEEELVIHPAAQVHVSSEVQVPCEHLQPFMSYTLRLDSPLMESVVVPKQVPVPMRPSSHCVQSPVQADISENPSR